MTHKCAGTPKEDEYGKDKAMEYMKKHLGKARFEDAIASVARFIENGELLAETDPTAFMVAVADKLARLDMIAEDQRAELIEIDKALGLMAGGVGRSRVEEIELLKKN